MVTPCEAGLRKHRHAETAGVGLIASGAPLAVASLHICDSVHGERSRALQPESSRVCAESARKAYALPAFPRHSPDPLPSGPACQVSSPAACRSRSWSRRWEALCDGVFDVGQSDQRMTNSGDELLGSITEQVLAPQQRERDAGEPVAGTDMLPAR